jgi:outer membrane protein insertion porin family
MPSALHALFKKSPLAVFLALLLLTAPTRAAKPVPPPQAPVDFPGATSFKPDELRRPIADQLAEIAARGLTPARADDAAFFLGTFYRGKGYARVEVTYRIEGKRLILIVKEGPRAVIRSIRFTGNQHHTAAELSPYITGVAPEALAAAQLTYSEQELSAAADRLRAYYASEGWLDATVDTKGTAVSANGTNADLVLNIVEGTRFVFGKITFSGEPGFSQPELIAMLGAKPTGAFTSYLVDAMQRSLQSALRAKGYFAVEVAAEWDKAKAAGGNVAVNFLVKRGAQFRIGEIKVNGATRLRPSFMQQRFAKLRDTVYDPAKVDETYRELLRTGLFQRLRVVPVTEGPTTLRLDVEVEEAKQKEIGFELGFGSYDGLIAAIRLSDRNLFGRGRPLSLRLESSQRGFRGELLYVDPWFLESEWSMRARLYSESRDELGYEKVGQGARLEFARKIKPRWEASGFIEAANSEITSTQILPEFLGPTSYLLTALGVTTTVDHRDDPLNPRRGWILGGSFEIDALDGAIVFSRATGRYSYYHPFGNSLLAIGARFGWIIPVDLASSVPIDLRYFNGGGNSVRSFGERELGPKDTQGNPLGGAFYTVANIEYDFPLNKSGLSGAVFVDAGNLTADDTPSLSEVSFAVGLGLRYALPIGPLRLDYGINPAPKKDDPFGAIHLSFGFAF